MVSCWHRSGVGGRPPDGHPATGYPTERRRTGRPRSAGRPVGSRGLPAIAAAAAIGMPGKGQSAIGSGGQLKYLLAPVCRGMPLQPSAPGRDGLRHDEYWEFVGRDERSGNGATDDATYKFGETSWSLAYDYTGCIALGRHLDHRFCKLSGRTT